MEQLRIMLELMHRPAFCAANGVICAVNTAASDRGFTPGEAVVPMLGSDAAEYQNFSGGYLYLTLQREQDFYGATITALGEQQLFTLEPPEYDEEFRLLTLAAQELREPLGNVMALMEELDADSDTQARIHRSLYQMLRIVGNMSALPAPRLELLEINALLREFWDKTLPACQSRGVDFTFAPIPKPIYTCADGDLMIRAVHNLLSNALKFTEPGGNIRLSATVKGLSYHITMTNTGRNQGVADPFHRFRREPGVEDGRHGLGLGMKVVRNAARAHGGIVLMDTPDDNTIRVRMSMPIRQNTTGLRSSRYHISYSGERDPMLIELSDVLPPEFYRK